MKRQYSNNEVKNAGKILTLPDQFSSQDFQFAQDVLTYWRTIHAGPINTFQATLRDKLDRLGYKTKTKKSRFNSSKIRKIPKHEAFNNARYCWFTCNFKKHKSGQRT